MNKRELILAKKTFEANQLKNKQRGTGTDTGTGTGTGDTNRHGADSLSGFSSTYPSPDGAASISMSPVKAVSRRPQTSTLSPMVCLHRSYICLFSRY